MIKRDELIAMRAIALCFKPFLKPEEALIYCNLGRTQFAKKCEHLESIKILQGIIKRKKLTRCYLAIRIYLFPLRNVLLYNAKTVF